MLNVHDICDHIHNISESIVAESREVMGARMSGTLACERGNEEI